MTADVDTNTGATSKVRTRSQVCCGGAPRSVLNPPPPACRGARRVLNFLRLFLAFQVASARELLVGIPTMTYTCIALGATLMNRGDL